MSEEIDAGSSHPAIPSKRKNPAAQPHEGPPIRVDTLERVKPPKGAAIWRYRLSNGSTALLKNATMICMCPGCGTTTTWDQFRDKKKGDWKLLTCSQKCRGAKKPKRSATVAAEQQSEQQQRKLKQAEHEKEEANIKAAMMARHLHKALETPEEAAEADVYSRVDRGGSVEFEAEGLHTFDRPSLAKGDPSAASDAGEDDPPPLWQQENRRSILRRFGLYRSAGIDDKTYWTSIVSEDVKIEQPVLEFQGDKVVMEAGKTQVIEGLDALLVDNAIPPPIKADGKSEKPRFDLQEPKSREHGYVDVGYYRGKHESDAQEGKAVVKEAQFIGRHRAVAHYDLSWCGCDKLLLKCDVQFSSSDQLVHISFSQA
jgi:hypothetical protein